MTSRRDPVPALARVIDAMFHIGRMDGAARATMGKIKTHPGSINAEPGQICATIDLRHPDDSMLSRMHDLLLQCVRDIGADFANLDVSADCTWHSPAIKFDRGRRRVVQLSAE